jgi:hypothetical protein
MEATGKSLVDHWPWAASKGLLNASTAKNLGSACVQVLSVLENWEKIDVKAVDPEEIFTRFLNLKGKDFTPRSLKDYRSRFRQAFKSYLSYVEDPVAWKPHMQRADSSSERASVAAGSRKGRVKQSGSVSRSEVTREIAAAGDRHVVASLLDGSFHRWELLNGLVVELRASRRLTAGDLSLLEDYLALLRRAVEASEQKQNLISDDEGRGEANQ